VIHSDKPLLCFGIRDMTS